MREPWSFFLLFFLLISQTGIQIRARAQEALKPTEVIGTPVDDLGSRQMTKPTQTFDQEELRPEQRNLSDALNLLPGVQSRLNGSPTISIRGSQSTSRSLVLTNGAPLNFSDGLGFNPLFISYENLDKVVILRGPASTLFGHDALAGAVEFKTEELATPKFYQGYGSFNTTQVFGGSPFDLFGAHSQITAYQTHSDGNYSFNNPRTGLSGVRQGNDQETTRATLIIGEKGNSPSRWKIYNIVAQQIGTLPGTLTSLSSTLAFHRFAELNHLSGTLKLGDFAELGNRSTYKYYSDDSFGFSRSESFRQGLSVLKPIGDHHVEVFGDLELEKFSADYLSGGSASKNLSEVGIADYFPVGDQINLQPAIRYSYDLSGILPSIGLVGTTPNQWRYFANYAEGFSPPSLTQIYLQANPAFPGPQTIGNPGLQGEHSTEVDLGFEKYWEAINVRFEAFSRDIFNLIQIQPVDVNTSTFVNVGHAHATGFELSVDGQAPLPYGVRLDYLNSRNLDTNSPTPLSPDMQISGYVPKKWGNFSIMIQDTYWSDEYDVTFGTNSLISMGSWNVLDFFISLALTKNIEMQGSALNILDQPREFTLGFPEPQRSFSVRLKEAL